MKTTWQTRICQRSVGTRDLLRHGGKMWICGRFLGRGVGNRWPSTAGGLSLRCRCARQAENLRQSSDSYELDETRGRIFTTG